MDPLLFLLGSQSCCCSSVLGEGCRGDRGANSPKCSPQAWWSWVNSDLGSNPALVFSLTTSALLQAS